MKSFYFPMSEYHCVAGAMDGNIINYRFPQNFLELPMQVDALRNDDPFRQLYLSIHYFPFARQDRRTEDGEVFSLKVFAELINAMKFNLVTVSDPHSDVLAALVNNLNVIPQYCYSKLAVDDFKPTCLVCPDAGAAKKISYLAQITGLPILQCGKSRDVKTGKLSGFWYHYEGQDLSRPLIVDDICDGGGTFIGLAKTILESRDRPVFDDVKFGLYVTHGGFTKGPLSMFEKIYTTDSLAQEEWNNKTVFKTVNEF